MNKIQDIYKKFDIRSLVSFGQPVLDRVLNNPRMNIIVGSIGMGKTAHTFLLAEIKHFHTPKNPVYVYVLDESKNNHLRKLLPSWINLSTKENTVDGRVDYSSFPNGSIIIIEELAGVDNSKNLYKDDLAARLGKDIMTVRHRNQFVFGNIQNTALLNKDLFRGDAHLHFKPMGKLAIAFERKELLDILTPVNRRLYSISNQYNQNLKSLVYLYSSSGDGVFQTSLPSFWSDSLSNLWGDNYLA